MQAVRLAIGIAMAGMATMSFGQTIASSSFDSSAEGWTAKNGATNFSWIDGGGDPGGYIQASDIGGHGLWFLSAPSEYVGNDAPAYGGSLSFAIKSDSTTAPINGTYAAVQLLGANGVLLAIAAPTLPTTSWSSFSFSLIADGNWKVGSTSGPSASVADMQGVLGDLKSLRINGDYYQGVETTGIDTVVLSAAPVPEPASVALWALGLTGMAAFARKARRS